ncbi:hypothetical protein N7492_007373 [Penicillium capsulatum]|uniref:trans-L-3-hydroxyproline dehydratase n=1 Tax=Penicillium capsulatum TaxID=69766 RepID=A0A9W9I1W5_9EURO|nr:hypothetical protein N7492_007373 [Penicillium capsulatum]KAJ6117213.1 hypothetical protein N7512_006938 [Penicillium capsulatum]
MDVAQTLETTPYGEVIKCIDMHTTGEPTRVVYSGWPRLSGTLLDQREQCMAQYDHLRKRIMLEPRGHVDMYGAIVVPETELVQNGEAHIGVLFTHNGGFSTMCGHATIALGRFFVDTHDLTVFPKRGDLRHDPIAADVVVNIHAPCGLIRVRVPTTADGQKSDPSRPVAFLSAPAWAAATNLTVGIPAEVRWPEFGQRDTITLDISYGGAFYALVDVNELGFRSLAQVDMPAMARAVGSLKAYLQEHPAVVDALQESTDQRLSFLYSVMVVDRSVGSRPEGVDGTETGLCFFADNQIDRSPTGSCVTARMALAHANGIRKPGQRWAYNSLVSNHFHTGAFTACIIEGTTPVKTIKGTTRDAVTVRVEGKAYYTGALTLAIEQGDVAGEKGFTMKEVARG